jgi:hypothetical protein
VACLVCVWLRVDESFLAGVWRSCVGKRRERDRVSGGLFCLSPCTSTTTAITHFSRGPGVFNERLVSRISASSPALPEEETSFLLAPARHGANGQRTGAGRNSDQGHISDSHSLLFLTSLLCTSHAASVHSPSPHSYYSGNSRPEPKASSDLTSKHPKW